MEALSRRKDAEVPRPHVVNLALPTTIKARLDLFLYSEAEERIPQGAYQRFFAERTREYFEWRQLDLGRFGFPPGYFVRGPQEMIQRLETALMEAT
jgi:hypothetical protein